MSPALTKEPRVLALLGWTGFVLAVFAFSWFNRLSPGSPFLIASISGSSLLGISFAAIDLAKYIFVAREFGDSMGSISGIMGLCNGAGAGA